MAFGHPSLLPFMGCIAAAVGFALFWIPLLKQPTRKRRFWLACLWFGAVTAVQLYWITANLYMQGVEYALWIAAALFQACAFGLLSLLFPTKQKLTWAHLLLVPPAWMLFEWGRPYLFQAIGWDAIGLLLSSTLISAQTISLWGLYGQSFWVLLTNLCFVAAYFKRAWLLLTVGIACLLFPYAFGTIRLLAPTSADQTAHVLLVQTAIPPERKEPLFAHIAALPLALQWERLFLLLAPYAHQPIDLIVFPEYTVPPQADDFVYDLSQVVSALQNYFGAQVAAQLPKPHLPLAREQKVNNAYIVQALANIFHADIIFGTTLSSASGAYNAALFFKPDQAYPLAWYGKRDLLPFVENIPFKWCYACLNRFGITASFTAAPTTAPFPSFVPIGMLICSEETSPYLARAWQRQGVKLLVNISNDAWWPNSRLPTQQLLLGQARALETGLPLIRACNTGVTAVLNSRGCITARLREEWQPAVLHAEVHLQTKQTLYATLGVQLFALIGGVLLLFCVIALCTNGMMQTRADRV